MVFELKKDLTEEQREINRKKESKADYFIYHYCLNENLPKEHPDFCFNCWIDEAEQYALEQQNWKYCKSCVDDKNLPEFTLKTRKDGYKIHMDMVAHLAKYTKASKEIVRRRDTDNGFGRFINGHTEADLKIIFDKFYPDAIMVDGIYKESE